MSKYDPHAIESRWRDRWEREPAWTPAGDPSRPPYYFLLMFPYPSGALHCGHWYMYSPPDAKARYLRMTGRDVLFPMGFDAFGLPAENAAIKHKVHPKTWTQANIEKMRTSFRTMGASFDWSREVVTCDPAYYRWTQWLFLEMFRNDLAYRTFAPVDWCPGCNTTIAREQIIGDERRCERCRTPVIKRDLNQWCFRITRYAEELLDFSGIDWPDRVKTMQRNWIGRSEGAEVVFATEAGPAIEVFTTRVDTVFGVTFLALAPEHPLVDQLTTDDRRADVTAYIEQARRQSEIQRLSVARDKTGVFTGGYATNPANGERVPVFVGDYVVMQYGSGAVMGVPAHDQRDFEFARKYDLPIRVVIVEPGAEPAELSAAFEDDGVLTASGEFDGVPSAEARSGITARLAEREAARAVIRYRMRDWLISRQRYWGAPIPIVHCPACGPVAVPDDQLPVTLPDDVDFVPTGESPLKSHAGFVNTTCPSCAGPAERDTDTMDTFVDSAWYWYRYLSPRDDAHWFDREHEARWLPVTEYAGGIEHATMHLLYARFVARALRDLGHVADAEPFARLFNQGLVLGEDNEKMSKSRGNVVDPDAVVAQHGADVLRLFLMFLGPWSKGGPWSSDGIVGLTRFLHKVWAVVANPPEPGDGKPAPDAVRGLDRKLHQVIRKVGTDIEGFNFNTAIAALMELTNLMSSLRTTPVAGTESWTAAARGLVLMLAPFAPHVAEELWEVLGQPYSVHRAAWPTFDPALAADDTFELVLQVNGRVRDTITVPRSISEAEARDAALASEAVQRFLESRTPTRVIYVPQRLVNLVVK